MDNELKNIDLDNAFRKAIETLETEPSDDFWKKAEANIAENVHRKDKQKLTRWKFFSLSLLLLLGFSGWYIISLQQDNSQNIVVVLDEPVRNIPVEKNENVNKADQPVIDQNTPVSLSAPVPDLINKHSVPETPMTPLKPEQPKIISSDPPSTADAAPKVPKTDNISITQNDDKINSASPEIPEAPTAITSVSDSSKEEFVANDPGPITLPLTQPGKTNRWQLAGYFAPTYTKRDIKDNDFKDSIEVSDVKNKEKEGSSWSAGIKLGYDLNNHWSLMTGAYYHHTSLAIEPTEITARQGNNGSSNYSLVTSNGTVEFGPNGVFTSPGDTVIVDDHTFQTIAWLGVPLQVQYKFGTRKVSFYASAGAALNLLVKGQTEIMFESSGKKEKEKIYSVNGLRDTHYSLMAGLGLKYMPARHFYLFAEPAYRRSITTINSNSPVKTKPSSLELGFGLGWHF